MRGAVRRVGQTMGVIVGLLAQILLAAGCSGSSTSPTPEPPPPNTPPVIKSLVASASRVEVGASVDLSATVEDLETAPDKLTYQWNAAAGTFVGEGSTVKWQAPTGVTTPANYGISVTVIEQYQALAGRGELTPREHRISDQVTVRVHDSRKEIGDLGLSFLTKFATSSISPEACLVDFSDSCQGKLDELGDIRNNRERYVILSHTLGVPRFTSLTLYTKSDMLIACAFESRIIKCSPGEVGCTVGSVERVSGDCRLTGVYEQSRWWLCVSNFFGSSTLSPTLRNFFGADVRRE